MRLLLRTYRTVLLLVFLFVSVLESQAQLDTQPASIKFGFKLPSPVRNKAFRNFLDGVADVHVSYTVPVAGNFVVGGGLKYAYFKIDGVKTPDLSDGKLNHFNGFAKLGLEGFTTDKIFYEIGAQGGFSGMQIVSKACEENFDRPTVFQTAFSAEPYVGLFMVSQDNLSFGLTAAWQFAFAEFDPTDICLDETRHQIPDRDTQGIYQSFNVGFSASIFVGRNRPHKAP